MTVVFFGAPSHPHPSFRTSPSRCALSLYSELSRPIIYHPAKESLSCVLCPVSCLPSSSSRTRTTFNLHLPPLSRPSNPNGKCIKHNLFSFCAERLSPTFRRWLRVFSALSCRSANTTQTPSESHPEFSILSA